MPFTSNVLNRAGAGRGLRLHSLAIVGVLALLTGSGLLPVSPALAQNIDEGKSAPQLFAGSCVTCHKSPNTLAKGRMTPTLFLFMQDHYTTSKSDAWALSSYLASVDTSGRSRARSPSPKKRNPAHPPAAASD